MTTGQLLEGKVALILGASRGIGEGIARAAFAAGAKLVIAARDIDRLESLAAELDGTGQSVMAIRMDMLDPVSLEEAVVATIQRFGRVDAAFNNAGFQSGRTPFVDTSDEMFDRVIAVNLKGVFVAMKHQLRAMMRQGSGAIVNTSSALGIVAAPFVAPYVASKHALIGLTKSAALEFAPHGIRINALAPGPVMTDLLRAGPASSVKALQRLLDSTPMARLGTVDEIAAAAIWLASDAASYLTGVALPVDGGLIVG